MIFQTVGSFDAPYENYFEAGTLLLAATVVTWMLFWMRRQSRGSGASSIARLDRRHDRGLDFGLGRPRVHGRHPRGPRDLGVPRRPADVGPSPAGALGRAAPLVGLAAAVAIGWGLYRGSRRIDLRSFFRWTGIGLIFIAAGLLSHAVHELIEVGALTFGTADGLRHRGVLPDEAGIGQFLRAIFGYSAAPESSTLVVHLAYLVVGPRALPAAAAATVPPPASHRRPGSAPPTGRGSPRPRRRA